MKRYLLPILGILIIVLTVAQVKARQQPVKSTTQPAAAAENRVVAEGRVVTYPGAEVTVGTDVAGTIETLNVSERDTVRRGMVIATIRADETRAALAEAKARVAEAEADIRLFEVDAHRARELFENAVGSHQAWDKSERDLDASRARRLSAIAEVRRLEALVAKTILTAPIDGVVITRFTHAGESVAIGAPVVTIADLKQTRIEAEIDEYDGGRVQFGAGATITAEGFDGRWRGTVEEIPDSVTTRRVKPQDTSKPIDTRVLLVKVALAEPVPLKLGQRVEVRIDTR